MLIAGVDPGLKGAIAFGEINSGRIERTWVYDMPVTELTDGRPLPDARAIYEIATAERADTIVLEHVEPRPRRGATSEWRFGVGYGLTRAALQLADLEPRVHLVRPKLWKERLGLTSEKKGSLDMARRLFPGNASELKRAKDDGRAEALLLIEYYRAHLLPLSEMDVC